MNRPLRLSRPREHAATITVSALSAGFGTVLVQASSVLNQTMRSGSGTDDVLDAVVTVFIMLSIYTASIVTANSFSTIVAGRTPVIALLRLVGATSRSIRREVALEGAVVGFVGALIGVVLGFGLVAGGVRVGVAAGTLPDLPYSYVSDGVVLPAAAVVLTTWLAALVGSSRVLTVTPIQATGAAQEPTLEDSRRRPLRTAGAVLLVICGILTSTLGLALGFISPAGLIVAFLGGVLSFTGIVLGAHLVIPAALRGIGALLGRGVPARLAAANAVRYPLRSTRATVGLLVGVTLVTTFTVANATFTRTTMSSGLADIEELANVFTVASYVMTGLVGFSLVIATVGLIDTLSLSVLQRTRELGLLRALGLTARQVRLMINAESVQMSVTAVGLGLLLGIGYGWTAAQSLLPTVTGWAVLVPAIPLPLVLGGVFGTTVLASVATLSPSRRATRLSPVHALAVD